MRHLIHCWARGALNALAALLPDTAERVMGQGTQTVSLSDLITGESRSVSDSARPSLRARSRAVERRNGVAKPVLDITRQENHRDRECGRVQNALSGTHDRHAGHSVAMFRDKFWPTRDLSVGWPGTGAYRVVAISTLASSRHGSWYVGDAVLVRPGTRVPADGTVIEGAADVDESRR